MKIGAALVVAGVLLVGPSACGSDPSSDSTGSEPAVAEKEAGIGRAVNLTVISQKPAAFELTLCGVGDGRCRTYQRVQSGESAALTATEGVRGSISIPEGKRVDFDAQNPIIGQPYIALQSPGDKSGREELTLSEGDQRQITFNGYSFVASRRTDSDDSKQLALEVRE